MEKDGLTGLFRHSCSIEQLEVVAGEWPEPLTDVPGDDAAPLPFGYGPED